MALILGNYAFPTDNLETASAAQRTIVSGNIPALPVVDRDAIALAVLDAVPSLRREVYEPWEERDDDDIHLAWTGSPFVSVHCWSNQVLIHHVCGDDAQLTVLHKIIEVLEQHRLCMYHDGRDGLERGACLRLPR